MAIGSSITERSKQTSTFPHSPRNNGMRPSPPTYTRSFTFARHVFDLCLELSPILTGVSIGRRSPPSARFDHHLQRLHQHGRRPPRACRLFCHKRCHRRLHACPQRPARRREGHTLQRCCSRPHLDPSHVRSVGVALNTLRCANCDVRLALQL